MNNFEQNLERLEQLTNNIKRSDISLEEALKNFEEGIKLAKNLEKEIEKIEGKIHILMNQPSIERQEVPQLDLFMGTDNFTGTAGAPEQGTRQ